MIVVSVDSWVADAQPCSCSVAHVQRQRGQIDSEGKTTLCKVSPGHCTCESHGCPTDLNMKVVMVSLIRMHSCHSEEA